MPSPDTSVTPFHETSRHGRLHRETLSVRSTVIEVVRGVVGIVAMHTRLPSWPQADHAARICDVCCSPVVSTGQRNHLEQLAINNDDSLPNRSPKCFQRIPPQPAIPITGFAVPPSYRHKISDLSANNRSLPSKAKCCVDRLNPPGKTEMEGCAASTEHSANDPTRTL